MRMVYGTYQHDADEVQPMFSREALTNEAGAVYGYRERWDLVGFKQAADAAALTTALQALEAAYSVDGYDARFLLNNGADSVHRLPGTTTIGGTRVVKPVSYPQGSGAEYTTYRTYTVSLECDVPHITTSPLLLVSWRETLRFTGGGVRYVWIEPRNDLPRRQTVSQATTYRAVQSGEAVGLTFYPTPPAPYWPLYRLPTEDEVEEVGPDRQLNNYTRFTTRWSYRFEAAVPLVGVPTLWPY